MTHYNGNHALLQSQSSSTGGSNEPSCSEGPSESLDREDLSSLSLLSEEVDGISSSHSSSSSERQPLTVECKPESDREQEKSKEHETVTESSLDTQTKPLSKLTTREEETSHSDLTDISDIVDVDGPHKGLAVVKVAASNDSGSSWQNLRIKCEFLLVRNVMWNVTEADVFAVCRSATSLLASSKSVYKQPLHHCYHYPVSLQPSLKLDVIYLWLVFLSHIRTSPSAFSYSSCVL